MNQAKAHQRANLAAVGTEPADSGPVGTVPAGIVPAGPEARLAELGIELPAVPAPIAAYIPAVRTGSLVFTAGQLPFVNGALPHTGKVGEAPRLITPTDATKDARTCAVNALAAVRALIGSLDRVTRVVKVTGYVASDPAFAGQPAVVNGASELLAEIFGPNGAHARSAVGVAVLPLDAPVEIELIIEITNNDEPQSVPHREGA